MPQFSSDVFDFQGPIKFTLGSDATGDTYYRNSGGGLTRVGIGSTNHVWKVTGGVPAWGVHEAFPVNSIYISVDATNPASTLGYGTWTAFGAGRMLVGRNGLDTDFDVVEETGGNKSVTPTGTVAAPTISGSTAAEASHTHSVTSNVAVADHSSHTHTYTDVVNHTHPVNITDPGHNHGMTEGQTDSTGTAADTASAGTPTAMTTNDATTGITATTSNPTGGVATGTTAGPNAALTHSITNNAVTSAAGSSHSHGVGTLAASAPAFTGNALSVLPPYIVVYMWKRIA